MNQSFKRVSVWVPLIIAIALCIGILIGSFFFSQSRLGNSAYGKLQTIMNYVGKEYVDTVNIDSLLEKSIPDILTQLDPHTSYIPASDLKAVNDELKGSFSGIGISFNILSDTITILEVISGGPSDKVGLIQGDRIVTINASLVAGQGWSQEKVINNLRGPENSTVKLGIKRSNSSTLLPYIVTRGQIPVTSIDACYIMDGDVGYLKINKFGEGTYAEFLNSMVKLRMDGVRRYIIDLRSNGGGYMEPAIQMANDFLKAGNIIVSTKGRKADLNTMTPANGTGAFQNEELIVLIDEFSASASEIFAGAIQDNDRGLIIGRRSFGKGLVQQQIDLPDQSAIRLTVARYYTPSGRCIQKNYTPGNTTNYLNEIAERYNHGEGFNADSMNIDKSQIFYTMSGREVYGGGGIVPDVYVPNDTTELSSYYVSIFNAGLLQKYAFKYTDDNRSKLEACKNVTQLMNVLPLDDILLQDFVSYAKREGGIAPRWYYINISRNLIVNQLRALIARDVLGASAYYEVINKSDKSIQRALKEHKNGNASVPISINLSKK